MNNIKKDNIQGFLFDLDGVFCIDNQPLPGAIKTLNYLNLNNIPYRFLTNTTTKSRENLFKKLISIGFPIQINHIISACYAGVLKLREINPGSCQLVLQDDAKKDYLEFIINNENPEYIVIGDLDKNWDFNIVNDIFNKVIRGSKILALHKGKYFQVSEGLQIDSGAFIKGIEYASSTKSIIIGKPNKDFFSLAINDLNINKENVIMIGDDIFNDIEGAQLAGIKTILVRTGKYRDSLVKKSNITPDAIIPSINELIKSIY